MSNGWTSERRKQQGAAIRRWRPWEHSTGPRSPEGKARSSRNAYRGGLREKERALFRAISLALQTLTPRLPSDWCR